MPMEMKENKFLYLISFIACMLVIVIHTGFPGNFGTVMEAVSRMAVPFFFVLSGRYLLRDGDDNAQKIREKSGRYFIKILKVTACVYIIYFIFSIAVHLYLGDSIKEWLFSKYGYNEALRFVLFNSGTFVYDSAFVFDHMWFLFALLYVTGLIYIFAPVLRKWYKFLIVALLVLLYFGQALQTFYPIRPFGISIATWYVMRNWLFIGMPFVLLGIFLSDLFRGKRNELKDSYIDVMSAKKPVFIFMTIFGTLLSIVEAFIFGKKEVYLGSLIVVVGIFLLSECKVFSGDHLYKIGKKSSNYIYYYHVLVLAVVDRLSYAEIIPYPPMWLKPFLIAVLCLILFYFAPIFIKKVKDR
ncbi:hypothetical protein D6856_11535 [Butyrivibrio sp. XB500-5]|nr:hypothetical protein D6856_11535 [Butyrivibrio sp. XB500-5]